MSSRCAAQSRCVVTFTASLYVVHPLCFHMGVWGLTISVGLGHGVSTTYLNYSASGATHQTQTTSSWGITLIEGTTQWKLLRSSSPSSCATVIALLSYAAITNLVSATTSMNDNHVEMTRGDDTLRWM